MVPFATGLYVCLPCDWPLRKASQHPSLPPDMPFPPPAPAPAPGFFDFEDDFTPESLVLTLLAWNAAFGLAIGYCAFCAFGDVDGRCALAGSEKRLCWWLLLAAMGGIVGLVVFGCCVWRRDDDSDNNSSSVESHDLGWNVMLKRSQPSRPVHAAAATARHPHSGQQRRPGDYGRGARSAPANCFASVEIMAGHGGSGGRSRVAPALPARGCMNSWL